MKVHHLLISSTFVNNSEMHSPATSTELTPETSEISAVWKEAWLKVQSSHQHSDMGMGQNLVPLVNPKS